MILLKDLLIEAPSLLTVYRGVNPVYGDVGLGINSTKIGDKLVATLGPNHTDNLDVVKGKIWLQRHLSVLHYYLVSLN